MIVLTPEQEDALIEIGNIGMSKAAKQLSILLNSTIKISIPNLSMVDIKKIEQDTLNFDKQVFSYVYQAMSHDLEGCAVLVFQRDHTAVLTMAVMGEVPQLTHEEARAYEQEALLEIGNIIISSCISVVANMFAKKIKLNLPVYDEDNFATLLQKLFASSYCLDENIIAISTQFDTLNDKLSGKLFIILTEDAVTTLLRSIEELLNGE